MASTELDRHARVDPADVPSAAWGWSAINYRAWHIAGLAIAGFLLLTLHGNHIGHVEDIFVVAFAALTLFIVFRDIIERKRGKLR